MPLGAENWGVGLISETSFNETPGLPFLAQFIFDEETRTTLFFSS